MTCDCEFHRDSYFADDWFALTHNRIELPRTYYAYQTLSQCRSTRRIYMLDCSVAYAAVFLYADMNIDNACNCIFYCRTRILRALDLAVTGSFVDVAARIWWWIRWRKHRAIW